MVARDAGGRTHEITLTLPLDYPASPCCASVDLPVPFAPTARPSGLHSGAPEFTVQGAVAQWEAQLGAHQAFWDLLDDLDRHTWVLEPEAVHPLARGPASGEGAAGAQAVGVGKRKRPEGVGVIPRRARHRRIALAPHASVILCTDQLSQGREGDCKVFARVCGRQRESMFFF